MIDQPIELQLRVLHGFVRDVAKGLHHLHTSGLIHRDMAARNICKLEITKLFLISLGCLFHLFSIENYFCCEKYGCYFR